MPNWCNNNIVITHNDKDKIKALFEKILQWTSKNYEDNGFGENWLGNVVLGSEIDSDNLDYRGLITCLDFIDLKDGGGEINIFADTAWCPMVKMWQRVVDKHCPGADIRFSAEESGNGVYVTNDYDYANKYVIDIWGDIPDDFEDGWESMWEANEATVIDFCQKALKTDETDIEKLLEAVRELDWVAIDKWECCEIEDCE